MPKLHIYEHQTFPRELNAQAVSFVRIMWPHIEGGMVRQMFATKLDTIHFVLVDDNLLHSYAAVVRFRLKHVGEEYEARGLTSVFSYPGSQKKGYGRQVIDAATNYIRTSGADIGILLTGSDLEQFYAQFGWETTLSGIVSGDNLTASEWAIWAESGPHEENSALKMQLFLSEKARKNRSAFETQPLYIYWEWGL